jgi:hypothetical protein
MVDPITLTTSRKAQHGNWEDQACTANSLKKAVRTPGWNHMNAMQQEAVDMVLTKVSRIVNGDPDHEDHWDDIAGYAHLGKGGHGAVG